MTAGLPGLGLSGLFVVLSTIILPTVRPKRRRSRQLVTNDGLAVIALPAAGRRRRQQRQQIVALVGMTVAIVLTAVLEWDVITSAVGGPTRRSTAGTATAAPHTGLPIIVISLSILTGILIAAELLFRLVGSKPSPMPPPVELDRANAIGPLGRSEPADEGRAAFGANRGWRRD
jgi:hypothetical protein